MAKFLKYLVLVGSLLILISNNLSAEEQCSYQLWIYPFFNTIKSIQNKSELEYPYFEQGDWLVVDKVVLENRGECAIPSGYVYIDIRKPNNQPEYFGFVLTQNLSANEKIEIEFGKETMTFPWEIELNNNGVWVVESQCRLIALKNKAKTYDCKVYPSGGDIREFNVLPKSNIIIYENLKELVEDNKKWSNLTYEEIKELAEYTKEWSVRNFIIFTVTCFAAIITVIVSLWTNNKTRRHRERLEILRRKRILKGLIAETKKNIKICKRWLEEENRFLKGEYIPFDQHVVDSINKSLVEYVIDDEDLMDKIREFKHAFDVNNNFLNTLRLSNAEKEAVDNYKKNFLQNTHLVIGDYLFSLGDKTDHGELSKGFHMLGLIMDNETVENVEKIQDEMWKMVTTGNKKWFIKYNKRDGRVDMYEDGINEKNRCNQLVGKWDKSNNKLGVYSDLNLEELVTQLEEYEKTLRPPKE